MRFVSEKFFARYERFVALAYKWKKCVDKTTKYKQLGDWTFGGTAEGVLWSAGRSEEGNRADGKGKGFVGGKTEYGKDHNCR